MPSLKIVSAAGTNANFIQVGPRQLVGWLLANTSASWRFVKIFSKASAPTPGTDLPMQTIALAPGSRDNVILPGAAAFNLPLGFGYTITGAYADLDTTVVVAGDVVGQLLYA